MKASPLHPIVFNQISETPSARCIPALFFYGEYVIQLLGRGEAAFALLV